MSGAISHLPGAALLAAGVRANEALQAPAVQSLRRLRFLGQIMGACVAMLIVALQAATPAASTLALTFVAFFLSGTTPGGGAHWALLPFTNALASLVYRVAGAAALWILLDVAAIGNPASVLSLALAAVAASGAVSFTRHLVLPATTRIAVVGSARSAEVLRHELLVAGVTDRQVIGVVAAAPEGMLGRSEVPMLGAMTELAAVLAVHDIDLLLIDGEASRADVYDQLAESCLGLPVRVCEVSQFYEDALGRVAAGELGSAWFRYIMHPRFRSPDTIAKRAMDLTIALAAGIVFAPVLCVSALAIKLYDGGPVLFRQRRIGDRGQEFTMLKLRTMRTAAAEARWSSATDDRITPIGRLLRRTHLDEVPQLINVLRGEMSVVGPRPEQPEFVERLEHTLPHYNRRHLIKPGLTGWAQVRCGYAGSDEGSALKLCNDLFYLKHQSLGLDLAILVETARTLIADRQFPDRAPIAAPVADETPAPRITPAGIEGAVVLSKSDGGACAARVSSAASRTTVALAVCVLALSAPAQAQAQTPSQAGYGETPIVALPQSAAASPQSSATAPKPAGAPARSGVAGNDGSGRPVSVASADETAGARAREAAGAGSAPQNAPAAAAPRAAVLDTSGERLPFTGMDLGVIALIAVALLACGVGLRRAATVRLAP